MQAIGKGARRSAVREYGCVEGDKTVSKETAEVADSGGKGWCG